MRHASFLLGFASLTLFGVVAACVGNDPNETSPANADSGAGSDVVTSTDSPTGLDAAPTCTAPQVACGTACIDPATFVNDAANCGACGRSCGDGSTCTDNKCSVVTILPQSAAASGKEIVSIAVDATSVYFDAPAGGIGTGPHGSIAKCPIGSCKTPIAIYDFQYAEVDRLLTTPAAPGYVYYTDNADDHAFRILADGGAQPDAFPGTSTPCASNPAHCAVDLATSGGHPYPLASDGTHLYTFRNYSHSGVGGVVVTLPSGATGNTFGEGSPQVDVAALGLAIDPGDARWLYVAGEHGLFAVETTSSNSVPVSLSNGSGWAGGIAVGNGIVLASHSGGISSVATCPAAGACTPGITGVFAATAGAEAMTSDATHVYWSATGHIYACPFGGCPGDVPTPIADTTARVRAITSDATTLYWGDDKGGLYRVAK